MAENRLSILIPTYNRRGKVARYLRYLLYLGAYGGSHSLFSGKTIHICDGSEQTLQDDHIHGECLIKLLKSLKGLVDITYTHKPSAHFYERMNFLAINSHSKYSMFCGDDDLLVFDYLDELVDFMNKNPTYQTTVGRYLNIAGIGEKGLIFDLTERPFFG